MGKLNLATMYLSGAMEYAADHGVGWRREFIRQSDEAGLGIKYLDPTNKPGPIEMRIGSDEDRAIQATLKSEGRFIELKNFVNSYRRFDLRFVDISDALIVMVDPKIPQWGTADELYTAEDQHKPIFTICPGALANLPNWMFDVVDINLVFNTVEEVIEQFKKLDSGEVVMDRRWVLVRQYL
jgi:hypothetical protein